MTVLGPTKPDWRNGPALELATALGIDAPPSARCAAPSSRAHALNQLLDDDPRHRRQARDWPSRCASPSACSQPESSSYAPSSAGAMQRKKSSNLMPLCTRPAARRHQAEPRSNTRSGPVEHEGVDRKNSSGGSSRRQRLPRRHLQPPGRSTPAPGWLTSPPSNARPRCAAPRTADP